VIPQRAFVLGAGLGTRLRPLTDERPKPLVPIYGKPLITFAFDHLIAAGVEEFVVNTHHCPEAYDRLVGPAYKGRSVTYRHEPVLLDTGGGIGNVADLLGDADFIVYNGDVLADVPLEAAGEMHKRDGNLATLILRSGGGPLQVRCDVAAGAVTDIRDALGGRTEPAFLFTGISIISPELLRHIPTREVVSIVPIYLELIRQGARIGGCVEDAGNWFDLGSINSYLEAHAWLAENRLAYSPSGWPEPVNSSATIHPGAQLSGFFAVGSGAEIGANSVVKNSVIWESARVEAGAQLDRCIVRNGRCAVGTQNGTVI